MSKVSILSYGIGNIRSVARALEVAGADITLISTPGEVRQAERLVLPGVGAFSSCLNSLHDLDLLESLSTFFDTQRPFLGICVGMQLMFDVSEEYGLHSGFGLINGRVSLLPDVAFLKRPSVGWHSVDFASSASSLSFLSEKYYLIHSYHGICSDRNNIAATYMYGSYSITAAVQRGPWCGVQFHPEKSGPAGITFLKNFISY